MNQDSPKQKVTITQVDPDTFVRKSASGKYIIEYRRDICIGAATCSAIAPFTFGMDDENKAVMLVNSDEDDSDDVILAAAQSCPVFAIIIKDAETGKQVFPPLMD